jgi:hypothetical protein
MEYIANKLGISVTELEGYRDGPNRSYRDFANAMGLIDLGTRAMRALGMQRSIIR